NFSSNNLKINFSGLSGTSAQISNVTKLSDYNVVGGYVINVTGYATDTAGNVRQNSTVFTVVDNIFPIVNATFNVTNAAVNSVVNYTANITDETGLLSANWTVNLSTGKIFANYTLSGTTAQISNSTSLSSCAEICVLNFTIYATDTSNNVKQNSTLIMVADMTPPVVNTTFNTTTPRNTDFLNFTGNVTDGIGLLSANWTVNFTTGKIFMNYSLSGTSAQVSNTTNLYGLPGGTVLNFTLYATDVSNNVKQNSTLLVVSDAIPPVVNTTFNITNPLINDIINFTGNITDETGLLSANITYNMSGVLTKVNFTLSGTAAQVSNVTKITSAGGSVINFTMYATDTSNNVRQNSTLITVANSPSIINTNYTIPAYPQFNRNVTLVANVTDADNDIIYVNFTLTAPNGTIYNLTNGSRTGDLHNASFNLTSYGTWKWNVTGLDSAGYYLNSTTLQIIIMQITENLNSTTVPASSPV
ncbi:MAG: hypothetical protein AABX32_05635, partial [Nanoarchaeota archaeon]